VVLVIVAVAVAGMIYAKRTQKVPVAPQVLPALPPSLSSDEHDVLRALAIADGKILKEQSVATIAQMQNLRVRQAGKTLARRGLIAMRNNGAFHFYAIKGLGIDMADSLGYIPKKDRPR